jgi:hypothetical protein
LVNGVGETGDGGMVVVPATPVGVYFTIGYNYLLLFLRNFYYFYAVFMEFYGIFKGF